jgi:DNA-binding transcriptional LysR family regulator
VCSPDLAARLERVSDLAHVPVIEDQATMLSWPRWFEAAGEPPVTMSGPRYSDPALAYDAAATGQGVLMAVERMSEDAVRLGQLVRPFAVAAQSPYDYWFVTSTQRRVPRKVEMFREWVMAEMGE